MLQTFKNGQGSIILRVKLLDSSATTGAGLTGLTSASSGLIISTIADVEASATTYTVAGSTIESITTLGTYAAPTATKCRFKEVDATNHKGIYEIQIADARFAVSNAKSLLVSILGATNLAQADFVVQLQSDDPYVAKPSNSNLLSIDGSGRVDLGKILGTAVSTPATAGILDVNVKNINNVAAATPGASGGLHINGSNAGTTTFAALTVTGALTISDGLAITRSTSNSSAITATGNGTGHGAVFTSGSGATGDGVQITAGSTNGNGMVLTKTGSGLALKGATTDLTLAKTTNITGFNDLTAAAIATGVWQDTTAGDFTTAGSIGKSLFTSGNAPGAASGLALVGSNMGTVSSVTGNVGGNVTGSVGSIATGGIAAASFAADAIDATALAATAANEIRDAVWAKAEAELTGDPGATPTVLQALMLPYMAIRNLRATDSGLGTDTICNSAGTIILTASITDAAGIFTKAKYA